MGIDVDRAYRIAFALGSGITAIAGGLMATYLSFGPFIGLDYVIIMYSGVVLGGMGSILGAFWGGLTVGFVQQMLGAGAAAAIAERGDLRGVPADRPAAAAGPVRPLGGARMRQGAGHPPATGPDGAGRRVRRLSGVSRFVTNSYYQLILTLVPIWALFGVSWNILSGYGGQLSFGHASFFGIGAYTVTLALVYWNLTPWLGIPLGMVRRRLAAVIIGMPTFRLRGHYFALSMLAYPLAILYFLQYLGFQEVSLPMHREIRRRYLEFTDPRLYTAASRSGCWSAGWSSACSSRTRASAWRCWRSGRTNWRPRRRASTRGGGRCAR